MFLGKAWRAVSLRILVLVCLFVTNLICFGYADFSFYWRNANYFLTEYRAFNTLDLDRNSPVDSTGNTRSFWTLKLRMRPSLSVTDRLSFYSAFDVFTNPFAHAQEGGALQGTQTTDTVVYGPNINPTLPRSLFGSDSGYGRSALTLTNNFLVKEGYLEYISDWGILKIGRLPRHWGLGIHYDAGNNPADKFSNRTDSVFYELGLGNFKVAGIFSKILENSIDSNSDDVTQWESYVYWNDPEKDFDLGLLYSYVKQSFNFVSLHSFDPYFTKKFKKGSIGIEGVMTNGDPGTFSDNKAQQFGLAAEFNYDWTSSFKTYLKTGYASGTELGRAKTLTVFAFNRNYDIALIMFNQGIGAIPLQTGVSAKSEPDANAIHNALYANIGTQYHFNDRIGGNLSYVYARAPEPVAVSGNKFYGQEVDLVLWYQFLENLKFQGGGGLFSPGDLYKGAPVQFPARSVDFSYAGFATATLSF